MCFSFRLSRIFCGTAAHYDRIAKQSSRSLGRVVQYTVRGTAFFHARHDIASSAIYFGSRLEDGNCGENFQVHLRPSHRLHGRSSYSDCKALGLKLVGTNSGKEAQGTSHISGT